MNRKTILFLATIIFITGVLFLMFHDMIDMPRMTQSICDGQLGRCLE